MTSSTGTWTLEGHEGSVPLLFLLFLVVLVVLVVLVLRLVAFVSVVPANADAPLGPGQPVFQAPPTSSLTGDVGVAVGERSRVDQTLPLRTHTHRP